MKKIDAVEMVRKIRDRQSKETTGKSVQDIIDYYRKKAIEFNEKEVKPDLSKR